MDSLLFGTAGTPISTKGSGSIAGIKRVQELGLGCMELEFVRGVKMSEETATLVKKAAHEDNVVLTAHGPYYINLHSADKKIEAASVQRILQTARVAHAAGAYSITFHPAYYLKAPPGDVYDHVKAHMQAIMKTLHDEGVKLWIRPETTGKKSAFGTLEEILTLSEEVEGVMPCIDWAHLHARNDGRLNSYDEFCSMLEKVEKSLGKDGLKNMHCHCSGIEYTKAGERNHLVLQASDFKYKELMRAFRDHNVAGCIICESPNIEGDALLMKEEYSRLS